MTKEELNNLVKRYAKRFKKDKNYYAMDYGTRFNPTRDPETNKIKYKKSPGDKFKPFWFCPYEVNHHAYEHHLTKTTDINPIEWEPGTFNYKSEVERRKKEDEVDMGIILPPCDLDGDSKTKGMANWGAFDEDKYKSPEHLKRIVKQIYDEKLPLAPCYSKSGGLHVYIFFNELVSGDSVVGALEYFKKKLKATAKEINPKQTKPTWDKKKKRWSPGNGILLPYRSCVLIKYVPPKKGSDHAADVEYSFIKSDNAWIKNENMEVGTLEEFLDYAETVSVDKDFFGEQPLELEEKKEEKPQEKKQVFHSEERDFSELNARPLSKPLRQIIQNIKNKKEHSRGGTFDNHVIDFVYGAMESKISDKHIHEHLDQVWEYADKEGDQYQGRDQKDYFDFKINNCRDKYDKTNPGPMREKFMHNIIFIKKAKKYFDNSTKGSYDKEAIEITYAHIFPKKTTPTAYFKEHPKKQLAEEETYRPDLYNEKDPLMQGADNLYYINNYRPGKIKPIKPEKVKDIEPFLKLMEHLATIEKERNHVLDILAYIIQKPWKKVKTITVFYTKHQRFGKGTLFDTLVDILGETNTIAENYFEIW